MRHTIGSSFDWVVFRRPTKEKNKIVRTLIIIVALIFLSGMAIEKRVEPHIIVSKYMFPYLASGSGSTQSTITLLKDSSKEGTDRSGATRMLWIGFTITPPMLQDQHFSATSSLIFGKYKWANIPLDVLPTPKCSVIDESWVRLTTAFLYSSCTTIWHFIFILHSRIWRSPFSH